MKFYPISRVADMIPISTVALRSWEEKNLIPLAKRQGGKRGRIWSEHQVYQILSYAESIGFTPSFDSLINYERSSNETKTKESGRQLSLR